jgi:endonuclease/exonuclease/phosphatase family metal-dependent hydrolase
MSPQKKEAFFNKANYNNIKKIIRGCQAMFWRTITLLAATLLILQNPVWASVEDITIKIVTLNLHNGQDSAYQPNLERFAQLIAAEQPDIISLQEVQAKLVKSLQIAGYQAISGPNANYLSFRFGNALLTKHQIIYHRHHYLPSHKEQRGVDEVVIKVSGRYLRILNTHLGLGWEEQKRQVSEISRISACFTGPLVITGDFNFEPSSKLLTVFPFQEVGGSKSYKTFPTKLPKHHIDHIWYNPDFQVLEARALPWNGSDHLPVMALLKLTSMASAPLQPVTIPDPTLQHNPLLPDVGERTVRVFFSWLESTVTCATTFGGGVVVPFAGQFGLNAGYHGNQAYLGLTYFKTIDLRDYLSLAGVRGKAEWNLTVAADCADQFWLEWRQYYRWSNHWGSTIVLTDRDNQPGWTWEQSYLPWKKIRLQFGADSEFRLRAGVAFSPNKHQILALRYRQIDTGNHYRLEWEYRW